MRHWLYILLMMLPAAAYAQQDSIYFHPDTTTTETEVAYRWRFDLTKKPDANKAVWLGVIFPGGGQIYNGSYWKLPIVYGAFMGCGYAISWNQGRYSSYKNAYLDLYYDDQNGTVSEDPSKSYIAVMPDGYDLARVGGVTTWMNTLRSRQNTYRRYRDYSIVAIVLVYALSLIDAYVDAQLFDYDISPDLSIHAEPQIYIDMQHQQSAELKLAIQF